MSYSSIPGMLPPVAGNLSTLRRYLDAVGYGVLRLPSRSASDTLRCHAWVVRGAGPASLIKDETGSRLFRIRKGDKIHCSYVIKSTDRLAPGDYTLWYQFGNENPASLLFSVLDTPFNPLSASFKEEHRLTRAALAGNETISTGQSTVNVTLPRAVDPTTEHLGVMILRHNDPATLVGFRVTTYTPHGFIVELTAPAPTNLTLSWVIY